MGTVQFVGRATDQLVTETASARVADVGDDSDVYADVIVLRPFEMDVLHRLVIFHPPVVDVESASAFFKGCSVVIVSLKAYLPDFKSSGASFDHLSPRFAVITLEILRGISLPCFTRASTAQMARTI